MLVELAHETDIPQILALSNWAAENTTANFATRPESLEEWLAAFRSTSEHHPWFVARPTGATVVAGFARSAPYDDRGAYGWTAEVSVYVDPEFQRRRVGTLLYQALISILRAQGYATLFAAITSGHEPSERMHALAGFTRAGTLHRAGYKFGRWHDLGFWELQLRKDDAVPGAIMPVREALSRSAAPGAR